MSVMFGIVILPPHVLSASTTAMGALEDSSFKKVIILALTQEQAASCGQEKKALEAEWNQCKDDTCRREVQKTIDAHNANCQ